ncbi:MAG: SurA N-terminal domain-containing protein [Dehalococcoidia bacterium]
MRKNIKRVLLGVLISLMSLGLVAGCGTPASETPTPNEDSSGAVAIVNGEEIAMKEFQRQLDQTEAMYEQQDTSFPEGEELMQLKQQIVDQLVDQALLVQEADSRDITVSEDEIQSQYEETVKRFEDEDAFEQELEEQGLSREDLKNLIADNIKIESLQDAVLEEAEIDAPTEDEVRELYDQYSQEQELPSFDEIKSQLEDQLLQQRQDEVIQGFIQELKEESTVEVLLEQ